MLVVKTGMALEQQIVRRYAAQNVIVLSGEMSAADLSEAVPSCSAIISMGLCGGLVPHADVAEAFIYNRVVTPDGNYKSNTDWVNRLYAATKFAVGFSCWSSGEFNTANNPAQRQAMFEKTGCELIDDESAAVVEFAVAKSIPWVGLRVVSDGIEDSLPPAVINALNPDGSTNLLEVIKSVATDPLQIPDLIKTAIEAKRSYDELENACILSGHSLQWIG